MPIGRQSWQRDVELLYYQFEKGTRCGGSIAGLARDALLLDG